jgi:CHAD domain-containing protein
MRQYLGVKVGELGRWVPLALDLSDQEAIHQARVTTRRLKAALDLLKPVLGAEGRRGLAKTLRRLRRSLGPLRDLDVMLGHLGEFGSDARYEAIVHWLRVRFAERRAAVMGEVREGRSPAALVSDLRAWGELESQVTEAELIARGLAKQAVPPQLESFRASADRLARDHSTACAEGEDVHQLRIAGKLLRYTLELAPSMGFAISPSLLRSFKKLQEALGLWHDYVVLSEQTLRVALDEALPTTDPRLYGQALELARACWGRSERHLAHFRELWAKDGGQIASQIEQTFGLAVPPEDATPTPDATGSTPAPATGGNGDGGGGGENGESAGRADAPGGGGGELSPERGEENA